MQATTIQAAGRPRQRADSLCRHCGEPAAEAVSNTNGVFCCAGCAAVFALIREHGLESFYACDVPAGISQREATRDADEYAGLEHPDAARLYVTSDRDGIAVAHFSVPALHCASCVWLIEQLWRFEAGVVRAEVDMLRRTVRVEFRSKTCSLRQVAERLAALGYPPVVESERPAGTPPRERRALYLRLGLAGFAFGNVMLFSIPRYANGAPLDPWFQHLFNTLNLIFAIPVLLYSAAPYFRSAWHALRARRLTLDVPVAIGLLVIFARSSVDILTGRGEGFLDSFSGLVFFLLVGRLFQQKAFEGLAFDRSVRSFLPLSVRVERGALPVLVPIEALTAGDVIRLRHQEVVPADAVLLDASGRIDYAFATGESTPVTVASGAAIAAGGRIVGQAVRLRVVRPVAQSRLVAMWNAPNARRAATSPLLDLSNRFGAWFTVVALGLAMAGAAWWLPDVGAAASVATAVLIIACPCALTLAAPITLGTAMSVLGRAGCFLRHPGVVLALGRVDAVMFDKTGTLTLSAASLDRGSSMLTPHARRLAARLAAESVHPVSRAIAALGGSGDVFDVREVPGRGVSGRVEGHHVVMGSAAMIADHTGASIPLDAGRTWVAVDGRLAGWFAAAETPRPGMAEAVDAIARHCTVQLLSGDRPVSADSWLTLFRGHAHFGLTPEHKMAAVNAERHEGRRVLMVGDGLNDAGALMAADIGLAVSDNTACLVPACDGVIRGGLLPQLPIVLAYARRARRVIAICFVTSVAYNVIGLSLALTGALTPLATAILMPTSSLTIVALSVGLMRYHAPVAA